MRLHVVVLIIVVHCFCNNLYNTTLKQHKLRLHFASSYEIKSFVGIVRFSDL